MKKITVKDLPSHEECGEAVSAELETPLHRFIYDNEPAGGAEVEREWRQSLCDLLNEHANERVQKDVLEEILSSTPPGMERRSVVVSQFFNGGALVATMTKPFLDGEAANDADHHILRALEHALESTKAAVTRNAHKKQTRSHET